MSTADSCIEFGRILINTSKSVSNIDPIQYKNDSAVNVPAESFYILTVLIYCTLDLEYHFTRYLCPSTITIPESGNLSSFWP